ncbi:unnamed protein product [Trichobilharzia szidati]|nr:unnamed protein product [Trichobilharzia szidati]
MTYDISVPDAYRYRVIFDQLQPTYGKLSGEKIREVFLKSQLPVETLGKIWDLSDIDNDGCLDQSEFIIAMHLVHRSLNGESLPDKLPQSLIPPDKEGYFSNTTTTTTTSNHPALCSPAMTTSESDFSLALVPIQSTTATSELLSPKMGNVRDSSALALVAFSTGVDTFTTQSTHTIPSVWSLSSHHHQPYLQSYIFPEWAISSEEHAKNSRVFAAIDLDADGLVSGPEVRDILMRSGLPQDILAQIWELVDIQNTGLLNSEQFTVAMHLATEQLSGGLSARSLPTVLPPSLIPPSLRPTPPDPSIFEESNKLIAEIEALNREKSAVESAYASLANDSQRRASEATAKQRTIDTLNHTSRYLANQRIEAERRLADYHRGKESLEGVLSEIKNHVMNERQKVEEMRMKINSQQASTKSQKEEIACLRNELNELIREEAMLQDKIAENQRRLEQIEKENRLAQSRVDQANMKLGALESTRSQLLEVLEQYNGLLNGDENAKEPDEARVKSLLSDESPEGSLRSIDTGLGGITWSNSFGPITTTSTTFGQSTLSAFDTSRAMNTGAQSVPLPVMLTNPLPRGGDWKTSDEKGRLNSSLGFPFPSDPFDTIAGDPFKVPSKGNDFHKVSADDPFSSLPITNDPFEDSDPFGLDPFGLPYLSMDKSKKSTANAAASAFDPFKPDTICPTTLPGNSLLGADFDAVFGPSNSGGISNMTDPFGSDPFAAPPVTSSLFMGSSTDMTSGNREVKNNNNRANFGRKSPPPRPKTQPTPGKSRAFKSMECTSSFADIRSAAGGCDEGDAANDDLGNYYYSSSATTGNSIRTRKRLTTTASTPGNSIPPPTKSLSAFSLMKPKSSSKTKKDLQNHHSASSTASPSANRKNISKSSDVIILSDEARLSWAIMESQRLAQIEEEARRQEEADLELALRLSQLDSSGRH